MSNWKYNGTEDFEVPQKSIAFIYLITNLDSGRLYVGRKMLTSTRKKVLTAKEKLLLENSRKKFKTDVKDTNWQNYWGTSEELTKDIKLIGKEKFKREILLFCDTKTNTSFYETYFQIKYKVLFVDSYNKHIANTKFFKGRVQEL